MCSFEVIIENEESDVLFDEFNRVPLSGGENWELMAAILFMKKLAKSSAVREEDGGVEEGRVIPRWTKFSSVCGDAKQFLPW